MSSPPCRSWHRWSTADPELAVLGGEWGRELAPDVAERLGRGVRQVPVVAAHVADPQLARARTDAVERLRSAIVASARADQATA